MSDIVTPRAGRLARPSWRDWRLLVGIVLVLAATALGARAVAAADTRVPVFVASTTINPGDRLTDANLRQVRVALGDTSANYLGAANGLPAERYAVRELRAGDLVPNSAVGTSGQVDVQPVVIKVNSDTAAALEVGSVVDLWVSARDPSTSAEKYQPAARLLQRVTVASVPGDNSRFVASSTSAAVGVSVPTGDVGRVIAAQDSNARFTLVPVAGSIRKSTS